VQCLEAAFDGSPLQGRPSPHRHERGTVGAWRSSSGSGWSSARETCWQCWRPSRGHGRQGYHLIGGSYADLDQGSERDAEKRHSFSDKVTRDCLRRLR
jgi:hypothetical protein